MTNKSCMNCSFLLTENVQVTYYGQSIGTDTCGAGRGPVAVPLLTEVQNETLAQEKASKCPRYTTEASFGEVQDTFLENKDTTSIVMLPSPEALTAEVESQDIIATCLSCRNYISPTVTSAKGYWQAGVCAARGILVTRSQMVTFAKDCDKRSVGMQQFNQYLSSMTLTPEFSNIGTLTDAYDLPSNMLEFVEPTLYESDLEVSEEDKTFGIRAWRKITDSQTLNEVYLPIFDPMFFSEEERLLIPQTGSDEHPEKYIDHMGLVYKCTVLWMHLNETPALWGQAGTGKSEFFRHMAWLMQLPFHRISITASTELEDLAGKLHYSPERGTYFEYGRIPRAWQSPGVICIDEPNVGPPDVWHFIRPLTDNSKQLVLDMNRGERINRHATAFLGMAMNPAWDVRNSGTADLADADGSRLMHIYVELPGESVERQIIEERCALDGFELSEAQMNSIMKIASEIRQLCSDNTLPITWGVRPQIKVARALRWFSMGQAYRLATADYLEPEQQQIILDVVKSHTPPREKRKPFVANQDQVRSSLLRAKEETKKAEKKEEAAASTGTSFAPPLKPIVPPKI